MDIIEWLNNLCVSEISFVNLYDAHASDYPMKNPGRYRHGFLYTIEGSETYHFNDRSVTAVPDSIIYLPRGAEYTITLSGQKSLVMAIDVEFTSTPYAKPFTVKFEKSNTAKSYFFDLEKLWNKKNVDCAAASKSIFYKIAASIIKQKNSYMASDKYSKISDALNYLHANYLNNDFKIEELSKISGISSRYFEKLFRQKFGVLPKEYVTSLRIERAKELLLSEKNLIGDVALLLGYCDLYHFSRIFKSKTGQTPSEYRREHYKKD